CFNEARFIGSVVARTRKYVDQVVVINDGSTDDSAEIAAATGATVHNHPRNQGYGAAISSALDEGRRLGADVLVIIDGDGQHDPKDVPHLVKPILDGQADIVIGSRFLGKANKSPLYRRIGQRVLNTATNVGSGQKLTDSQSGCRAYSAKALEKLNLSERGMAISSQMQFAIKEAGLRVAEVPIDVLYEEKAKRNPVGHGANVLTRVAILFTLRHPMLVFGAPGLVCWGTGLWFGFRVLTIYNDTDKLASGHALAAILFCLAGLLGLFAALMLQAMKELIRGETSDIVKQVYKKISKD
ncbi:MAG: glycosyltransferase family 2 protein, partial [Chloroflexi bacterium]|nr:glycosyltransferase family 2 protein [Chloroflexota bacterium]